MALDALLDAVERLPAFNRVFNTLPAPGGHLVAGGLPGSADAAVVAALARRLPTRFFVVATEGVGDAERWLADLQTLLDDFPVALYPPREGFGEAEPHMEVAGERVETLERLTRGELRVLLTTARALSEKTRMPSALRELRVELRKGENHRLSALAEHLESIGFERVPMVEDVAQFSIRGGIFDVYSFGMAEPVRAEFWGDTIEDLRHFDLATQRSTRAVDFALVLPVDGHVRETAGDFERGSIVSLFPPDTLLVIPRGSHVEPELRRTWDDAEHHIELARGGGGAGGGPPPPATSSSRRPTSH
jgi:transcription-repair coupling factor (superfamily II helicase)